MLDITGCTQSRTGVELGWEDSNMFPECIHLSPMEVTESAQGEGEGGSWGCPKSQTFNKEVWH